MLYDIWVRHLKVMRRRQQWTQKYLARQLGISRTQYSAIESGRSVVNYGHLYNLGKIFKVPLGHLLAMSHLELTPDEKKLCRTTISKTAKCSFPANTAKGQSSKRRRSSNGYGKCAEAQENNLTDAPPSTSARTSACTSKQERGRPRGSRVILCMCDRRIYGQPDEHVQCTYCGAYTTMPKD